MAEDKNTVTSSVANKIKLPTIKPKINSTSDELIMSRIHILKNWELPNPTSHIASGRKRKDANDSRTSVSANEALLLKKQRQNRDAQRAYRERKERKFKEMESIIDALQNQVKYWKKLYQSKCREMSDLENRYDQLMKETQNMKKSKQSDLYGIINNFKPLKPVPLRSSTNKIVKGSSTTSSISSSSTILNENLFHSQSLPILSKSSDIQTDSKVTQPYNDTRTIRKQTDVDNNNNSSSSSSSSNSIASVSCGFCDGSSSCICDELTSSTMQKGTQAVDSPIEASSSKTLGPMTIAQLTCSSDPHNCTKCSDINETCIKPTIQYMNNSMNYNNNDNNDNNDSDYLSSEIDFTNYK